MSPANIDEGTMLLKKITTFLEALFPETFPESRYFSMKCQKMGQKEMFKDFLGQKNRTSTIE